MISLKGSSTFVVGGSRGIGAAVVRLAARAGSNVAWTYSGSEKGRKASVELKDSLNPCNGEAVYKAVNCTDESQTRSFVQGLINTWGGLDGLVVNAGFTSPVPFSELDLKEWDKVIKTNLTGAFIASHAAVPHMKERGRGSIVFIGSAAVVSGGGGRADYISAKAGLEGLNRAITKEFAPSGIRSNLVHPSLIETDLLKERYPDADKRAALAEKVPLRRLGTPEDIANLVVFLLSDMASYITGQSIFVDGGRTFCK